MLKSLRIKEFNKYLNGGIAHFKPFPGSKAKQMDHHIIPILEEHQYDAQPYMLLSMICQKVAQTLM